MIGALFPIIGGLIAATGLITKFAPGTTVYIEKLAPYQGWIGVCCFFWGVWELISVVLNISILSVAPLHWIFWLLVGLADFLLGILLGFNLIAKYILSKAAGGEERGRQVLSKLMPFQAMIGLFAIVMGVLYLALVVLARTA